MQDEIVARLANQLGTQLITAEVSMALNTLGVQLDPGLTTTFENT